ncbi:MAG: hypothetical protein AAF432_11555 [Planctomycetota bacterium]
MTHDPVAAKAAPRRQSGAQRQHYSHHRRTIEQFVPEIRLVDDYIVMAAMVGHPDWVSHVQHMIRPVDFNDPRHQQFVRACLWQLNGAGRAHLTALKQLMLAGRAFHSQSWNLFSRYLIDVADLLPHSNMVEAAVLSIAGNPRGAAA